MNCEITDGAAFNFYFSGTSPPALALSLSNIQASFNTIVSATGLINGNDGLTISSGHTSLRDVSMNTLNANDLTAIGTTSLQTTTINNLTASGTISLASPTLTGNPTLTGTPTAPTPMAGDNTTKIATTAFVTSTLTNYVTNTSLTSTLTNYALTSTLTTNYAPLASPTFTGTVQAPTFNATSDYRIKQDIHEISQETTVDKLNPVTYKNTLTGKQDMGFIAHELQEHFPFLVSGEKDGPTNQSVNYIGLIALLTKEIQELKQRVLILEETQPHPNPHQTR